MSRAARRFNLVQAIAVTTAAAAGTAFFRALIWPPLGSSGLGESRLPAVVLVGALWFCGRSFSGRMVVYAVVGTFIAAVFCLKWLAASDSMFGHYDGPPPWIIVGVYSAYAALAASGGWFAARLTAWYTGALLDEGPAARTGYLLPMLRGLGMGGLVLVSVFVGLVGGRDVTNAWQALDSYVEKGLVRQQLAVRQWAERLNDRDLPHRAEMAEIMASRFVLPDDEAAIPTLAGLLSDDDLRVRRAAAQTLQKVVEGADRRGGPPAQRLDSSTMACIVTALDDGDDVVRQQMGALMTPILASGRADLSSLPATVVPALVRLLDRPEPEASRMALEILGAMGPSASAAVEPVTALMAKSDATSQALASRALARIQPESVQAVQRLAELLTKPYDPGARMMAARELGAMGPAARAAIPKFVEAWETRMLTIEDAQAMYLIDPQAAADAHIPRKTPGR